MNLFKAIRFFISKYLKLTLITIALTTTLLLFPKDSLSLDNSTGEKLFIKHCSGCHINGGNIIRRRKTLKIKDLKRNNIESPQKIAEIARLGIGSMGGYKELLGENGDEIVANWIWNQSQKDWSQG